MKQIDFLKRLIIVTLLAAVFLLAVAIGRNTCHAYELTVSDYENTIKVNEAKIAQCEDIKTQINKIIETVMQQEWYNEDFVNILSANWESQNIYQSNLIQKNNELRKILDEIQPKHIYIGNFKITHYCAERYSHRCNDGSPSVTATGTTPTPGRTIAVDPKKIPYGTKVIIDGKTYTAEDTGGSIKQNRIDICVATHAEALQKGVIKNAPVYIVKE